MSRFFEIGEKCEKPRTQAHPELQNHELDREKMRMNSVLGENLEGLHQPEKQRSAPHSAQKCVPKTKKKSQLNSVLGENLEDAGHHCAELECQRSAAFGETKESGSSALPPAVPPAACRDTNVAEEHREARSWALR